MIEYTSIRLVDGKLRKVIVDETGKIINRNPSKEELKGLEKEQRYDRDTRKYRKYTDEELLNELRFFKKEEGRIPTSRKDFNNNPGYPSFGTYIGHFGSWSNALKKAGLDIDLMGCQGNKYKGRQAEIIVLNHFKNHPVDLAGENQNSYCDGICPNGDLFEVKSAKFETKGKHYHFVTRNKDKDDDKEAIQWYYLLAFNRDYTKLDYAWRIPGEMVDKDHFYVYIYDLSKGFNIENMKEYDITERLKLSNIEPTVFGTVLRKDLEMIKNEEIK